MQIFSVEHITYPSNLKYEWVLRKIFAMVVMLMWLRHMLSSICMKTKTTYIIRTTQQMFEKQRMKSSKKSSNTKLC